MKVSISWLKEYIEIDIPVAELAEKLTMSGFEVESVESQSRFDGIVLGRVLEVAKHPNADRLSVCKVNIGDQILDIVCGAPNVAADQLVPVATVGTRMPEGFEIKAAKIRGSSSNGMICSKSELGFEEGKSEGIWVLDANGKSVHPGLPFDAFLGSDDSVIEIALTYNRPDCLSLIGIAREISVFTGKPVRMPEVAVPFGKKDVNRLASVEIEDEAGCPRYSAAVIEGVKIGPSPDWLVNRLESVGLRPINNIVDVTNYVMVETGQPLHAFDYDTLQGHKIVVKKSKAGEKFTTLDDKQHTLDDQTVMICDGKRTVAIGGIMGGQNSEITDQTVNVLLESAYFNPLRVRVSARRYGITSDASMRFSRGTDPKNATFALKRSIQLFQQVAGGAIANGIIDVYPVKIEPKAVQFRPERAAAFLGKKIPKQRMIEILEALEMKVSEKKDALEVTCPTFRPDLEREADLIEEVARVYGYNNIESLSSARVHYDADTDSAERLRNLITDALISMGFQEVTTNSMVSQAGQERVTQGGRYVEIQNAISEEMAVMRVSMLPSLLEVVRRNVNNKNPDLSLFEIGRVFFPGKNAGELPNERTLVAGVQSGQTLPTHWLTGKRPANFFDFKGVMSALLAKISLDNHQYNPYDYGQVLRSGRGLEVSLDGEKAGYMGELEPMFLKAFDLDLPICYFELYLDVLKKHASLRRFFEPIRRFPFIKRDLSLTVDKNVPVGDIQREVRKLAGKHLVSVEVFDLYDGEQVGKGKKSLGLTLLFQSPNRTLTEAEVDAVNEKLLQKINKRFGAFLRSDTA